METVAFILCGVSVLLIKRKYICMYKSGNMNSVNSVILHMSSVLLYLQLKLALNNIKMKGKNHANN